MTPFELPSLAAWLSTAVVLGGCDPKPATQTIVVVHAESSLLERASSVHVRVQDDAGELALERSKPVSVGEAAIARVPLVPKNGDASRRFVLSVELRGAGDAALARAEVRGGYVEDERHDLHVWLDASCENVVCGEGRTCQNGECVGSCFDVAREETRARAIASCGECEVCTSTCVAASDLPCGCPGESCSSGRCAPREQVGHVSAGAVHTCASVAGGKVYCWGSTTFAAPQAAGRLGTGSGGVDSPSPVVVEGASATLDLSTGSDHTCALSGTVRSCWGANFSGQLGGASVNAIQPVPLALAEPALQTLSSGFRHTCGIGSGSTEVFCWGENGRGNLGFDGTPSPPYAPVRVGDGYRTVAAGGDHTCALRSDGTLECWGFNESGQLGVIAPSGGAHLRPGCEPGSGKDVCFHDYQRVALGAFHTCALRADGALYCWGGNQSAQLGVGPPTSDFNRADPILVSTGPWSEVGAGRGHTCALDNRGALYCWGLNEDRQLGLPSIDTVNTPTPVDVGLGELRSISLGSRHTCAITASRRLYCWGKNDRGQIGVGLTGTRVDSPRRVCF